MSRFGSALDDACDARTSFLKRDLTSEEVEELEDRALADWIKLERFDELIEYAHEAFELRDGQAFCASLGSALARRGDRSRFETLFRGLAKSREAAFWRTWPQAQSGHVGAMKESSMHVAHALDAMAGLYTCSIHRFLLAISFFEDADAQIHFNNRHCCFIAIRLIQCKFELYPRSPGNRVRTGAGDRRSNWWKHWLGR